MVAIPRARLLPPRVRSRASTASARASNRPIRFLSSTRARPRPRSRVARVTNDRFHASEAIARRRARRPSPRFRPRKRVASSRASRAGVRRARAKTASFSRVASRRARVVRARAVGARRRVAAPPPNPRAAARVTGTRASLEMALSPSRTRRSTRVFRGRFLDLYCLSVCLYAKVRIIFLSGDVAADAAGRRDAFTFAFYSRFIDRSLGASTYECSDDRTITRVRRRPPAPRPRASRDASSSSRSRGARARRRCRTRCAAPRATPCAHRSRRRRRTPCACT